MFEQELYSQEVSEVPVEPGDLFYNYEIKNWNFTPRLYKILVGSAIANILALVVIGSSGLLTARGCDSPFVGRVCQVLDTVYIGSMIFGTDREYADVDFDKTLLEDADVTFVDVTGVTPPLSYPAGYFQLANPEQQFPDPNDPLAGFNSPMVPGFPSNPTTGGLINTPPVRARNNPNAVVGQRPDSPLGTAEDEDPTEGPINNRKGQGGQLSGNGKPNSTDPTQNAKVDPKNPTLGETVEEPAKEDKYGVFINKRPMRLEATESLEQIDGGKVKIDTPFRVTIGATLGLAKDGKTVVLKNPKPIPTDPPTKNDPKMEEFVRNWILAVGDAGWFGYLAMIEPKPKKVIITVEQNDTDIIASVKADQPTENQARSQSSSLGLFLAGAVLAASGDDQVFLKQASVTSEGKNFVLNFKLPKPQVHEMIMRKLAEQKEKDKQQTKPESTAHARPEKNTAEK